MLVEEKIDDTYITKLIGRPLLSPIAERILVLKVAQGDRKSLEKLVEHNMRLVLSVAKSYANSGIPLEDLVQEGAIGLMLAAERFDPSRNLRFSTYATQWIRQQIGRAVDNKAKCIRIPSHALEASRKIDKAISELEANDIEATVENIAAISGLSIRKVIAVKLIVPDVLSLDFHMGHEATAATNTNTLGELLIDESAVSPEAHLLDGVLTEELVNILSSLTLKELSIIQRRFGMLGEDKGILQQISDDLGISRERSRILEQGAIKKLRASSRSSRIKRKLQEAVI